jgi:tetratricopeptide (TPR) repeat protein/predicted Ser/Thr protein kinase
MTETAAGSDLVDAVGEPVSSTHELMAQVRPGEVMGARLVRARVLGALFGDEGTVGAFGRFRVLERLGAGGMGVVYEAYDPDLARGVALKLVNVAASDRETALAEAKALARLSHPNVVPIYDVGLEGEHVYLVMELVRGKTLRQWPEGRALREILTVYQQAGIALAAAHDVGLVHRDFKPDNAIVGTDGRVRVVDFGLACEADDPAHATRERRAVAGTPHFMAPEIKAGAAITPAADQYSFCVALGEALAGAGTAPPRRIAAVLARGRADDPAKRFATMGDLLRALARDPARTWRRVAAGGGLVAIIGAMAFAAGRQGPSEADACDEGAARLAAAWPRTARSAALDRVAVLGAEGPSLRARLERDLAAHDRYWVSEYRAACRDRRRQAETDTMSERRATCLRRGSDALAAVGELIRHAEPANLVELPRAVQSLPDPAACSDPEMLGSEIARPPLALAGPVAGVQRQVAQARIQVGAGRYTQALAEARAAVVQARALGYRPALAEALLVEGAARMRLPDRKEAIPILEEATTAALASNADAMAVEAWARRAWAQGTSIDPGGALAGVGLIEPLALRTPSAGFARALLYNNLGSVELGNDHKARAQDHFSRALTEARKVTGDGALELVAIRANIGISLEDRTAGDSLLIEAADELASRLGQDHPDTLELRWMRGAVLIEDLQQAAEVLTPVCGAYERHTSLAGRTAECWTQVGLLRWDLGDRGQAIEAIERAAHTPATAPEALAYVTLLRGDARTAARQFEAAIAAIAPAVDDQWWDRLSRAYLTLGLGRARRALGDLHGARQALERTIAELASIVGAHPATSYERHLGRARVELAFVLAALGAGSSERAAAATPAVAWLRGVGGTSSEIEALAALVRDSAR